MIVDMPKDLDKTNAELEKLGIEPIKDVDATPERTAYYEHLSIDVSERKKDWNKILKYLGEQHLNNFHKTIAQVYPHLLFEKDEDKTYWLYNEETGVYDELTFTVIRGLVISLLLSEGFAAKATEAFAKGVLNKYRSVYAENGYNYDDFDSYTDWFHAANGWVHVNTLEFKEHSPEMLSRRASSVPYDDSASCPTYDKFLDEQVQLAGDQVRAIDQFSGLLLTPDISRQKMLVLIGKPGSGKSTLLDCWSDILGDCATQVGLSDLQSESFRFRGSSLVGKNLCWFDEVEVTRSNMGNSLINLVTGQHIQVERKGINGIVEADNQLKCVLTANTLPRSAEMGIYRRMILIYLEYSFYDNMTANHRIREVLQAEGSGILNRMLKGLADLNKNDGFTVIEGHADLIEDYKTSSNTVAEFLDEYFVFDEAAEPIQAKTLLATYKEFNPDRYSSSLTPQRFGTMIKQHGLSKFNNIYSKHTKKGNVWCGLKLREYYEISAGGVIVDKSENDF